MPKFNDLCLNPKCKSQKQTRFSPKHFQLEGTGYKKTYENTSRAHRKRRINLSNQDFK